MLVVLTSTSSYLGAHFTSTLSPYAYSLILELSLGTTLSKFKTHFISVKKKQN